MYLEIRNGAHFSCDVLLNFLLSFQMKNFETNKTTKKIKKSESRYKETAWKINNERQKCDYRYWRIAKKLQNSNDGVKVV